MSAEIREALGRLSMSFRSQGLRAPALILDPLAYDRLGNYLAQEAAIPWRLPQGFEIFGMQITPRSDFTLRPSDFPWHSDRGPRDEPDTGAST